MKKTWIKAIVLLGCCASMADAQVLYQDAFDNDGLDTNSGIGGGLATRVIAGGPNFTDDGDLSANAANNNNRGLVYTSNSFDLSGGFELQVVFNISALGGGANRLEIGLLNASSSIGSMGVMPFAEADFSSAGEGSDIYGIGGAFLTKDPVGLHFVDGAAATRIRLVTNGTDGQQITANTDVVMTLTMDTAGNYTYDLSGNAQTVASSGTISGFDLSENFYFVVGHQDKEVTKDIKSVTLSSLGPPPPNPVPVLSTATNEVTGPFTVDVVFDKEVSGVEESDFDVSNGSIVASSLTVSNASTYSVEVAPSVFGEITVVLPAGSATSTDGSNTLSMVSNILSVDYPNTNIAPPIAVFSTVDSTVTNDRFVISLDFSEPVTGLKAHELSVSNGYAVVLPGDPLSTSTNSSYTFTVFPTYEGTVSVSLPANKVTDTDGNNLQNPASDPLLVDFQPPVQPALYGPASTDAISYDLFISFPQKITGLTDSDFIVVNGTASGTVSTSEDNHDTHQTALEGRFYKTTITVDKPGTVEVSLPAGAVHAAAGDQDPSLASSTLITTCTDDFGDAWIVDSAADWADATAASSNLVFSNGFAEPTNTTATFTSQLKTFSRIRKPRAITFQQSAAWDNWTQFDQIGPGGGAPIFLPIANDDYYYIGGKKVYHSTDMTNWTQLDSLPGGYSGWTTSAEYKDGTFYVITDSPNDEDPVLLTDDNLMDSVPGTIHGAVFVSPHHGSDASLFRDDRDGLFHIIYEDHSPLSAGKQGWDSPLAGHTSSPDAIHGFGVHEHHPAVDLRTTPTGEIGIHGHPHHDYDHYYQVHSPKQDAFGDWTTIKIGERYYLFGDFHHTDGSQMSVACFASDSIYEEFELVGELASDGHPDPTCGFAEGQFYVITQKKDLTSPGPWVEGVEARAGVDTDGDGTVDQWTDWQIVRETYDHKPGYARVVDLTPAQIDMSGLQAGYGFQFELNIDNTVASNAAPIMDRVEISFEPGSFQQWSNANDMPADPAGDLNGNGMEDLIEFATGMTAVPTLQSNQTVSIVTASEAMEEYGVDLMFSTNLFSWLPASDGLLEGITRQSDEVNGDGDNIKKFGVDPLLEKLFWRIKVSGE